MRHAMIMAGGAGVRLWPLSRRKHPKQLLHLFDGTSLLRRSYERVAEMLPPAQIHVITGRDHLPMVAEELPELPAENLIGEPEGRDTANAVGLAAAMLAARDPEAVIGMFTADHIITPIDRFAGAVDTAFKTAEAHGDALVTMGICPSRPDTNYGYVHRGARISDGIFLVQQFTEKPNLQDAQRYVAGGEYYWNSGMFAWQASTILGELAQHLPASHAAVCDIAETKNAGDRKAKLDRLYPTLEKISIDFAVMEKAKKVFVVEMDCRWLDVGAWPAIEGVIEPDGDGNVNACERVTHSDSKNNIVVSEESHLVATMGVEGLVIIHAPDATLVCKRDDVDRIKDLVGRVSDVYGDEYR